jgi:osmoprotectant transport system substrate-binding protein
MTRTILRRTIPVAAGLLATSLALAACGSDDSDDPFSSGGSDAGTIVVGSANFPESELLMEMYAQALESAGVEVETKPNIGAREIYMEAFSAGDIDLLPEYNGALLAYLMPEGVPEGVTTPDAVYDALQDVLPDGSQTLPQSDAEDKDTLTVTKETAEEYSLDSIDDLAAVDDQFVIGAGPEWQERYQGLVGLKDLYGIEFKEFKPLDAGGPLTVAALKDGSIDVGNIFSTDSSIVQNDFVVLDDPKNLYLSENIVPLIQSEKVTPEVEEALNGVSEALTTDNLTAALARVQVDKDDPKTVAAEFLEEHGLS